MYSPPPTVGLTINSEQHLTQDPAASAFRQHCRERLCKLWDDPDNSYKAVGKPDYTVADKPFPGGNIDYNVTIHTGNSCTEPGDAIGPIRLSTARTPGLRAISYNDMSLTATEKGVLCEYSVNSFSPGKLSRKSETNAPGKINEESTLILPGHPKTIGGKTICVFPQSVIENDELYQRAYSLQTYHSDNGDPQDTIQLSNMDVPILYGDTQFTARDGFIEACYPVTQVDGELGFMRAPIIPDFGGWPSESGPN